VAEAAAADRHFSSHREMDERRAALGLLAARRTQEAAVDEQLAGEPSFEDRCTALAASIGARRPNRACYWSMDFCQLIRRELIGLLQAPPPLHCAFHAKPDCVQELSAQLASSSSGRFTGAVQAPRAPEAKQWGRSCARTMV